MRIPAAQVQIGPVPFGETGSAKHLQFGDVTLHCDGKVDDAFKPSDSKWLDIDDPRLGKLVSAESQLFRQSAQKPTTTDYSREYALVLEDVRCTAGLGSGCIDTAVDSKGAITGTFLTLTENRALSESQGLSIKHTPQGTIARLISTTPLGVHEIVAPVGADGSLVLKQATEKLMQNVPWLNSSSLDSSDSAGIMSIDDPRLERIADASEGGLPLGAYDLGDGWSRLRTSAGNVDTWYTASQEVSVDRKDGSFTLSSQKLHCAPASSDFNDYCDVSQICWKKGSIQRVKVPQLTQAKKS